MLNLYTDDEKLKFKFESYPNQTNINEDNVKQYSKLNIAEQ